MNPFPWVQACKSAPPNYTWEHTLSAQLSLTLVSLRISSASECCCPSFAPVATHPLPACIASKSVHVCDCMWVCVCMSEWMASALCCSLPAGYSPPPDSSLSLSLTANYKELGVPHWVCPLLFPLLVPFYLPPFIFCLLLSPTELLTLGSIMLAGPGDTISGCVGLLNRLNRQLNACCWRRASEITHTWNEGQGFHLINRAGACSHKSSSSTARRCNLSLFPRSEDGWSQ